MSDIEREKFKILLNYWVRHNREHGEDFKKWANKAKEIGETEVFEDILEAMKLMDNVNKPIIRALERLKNKNGHSKKGQAEKRESHNKQGLRRQDA